MGSVGIKALSPVGTAWPIAGAIVVADELSNQLNAFAPFVLFWAGDALSSETAIRQLRGFPYVPFEATAKVVNEYDDFV
jgi:hypothetical protein